MLLRKNTTKEADRKAAHAYLGDLEPRLTSSNGSGQHDDLYSRRLLRQLLAELEDTLPDTHHIAQLNYDSDPRGYTESVGMLLLVPAVRGDRGYALAQHKLADRIVSKAFATVCDWHPDDGGLVLSTYGVYDDGVLAIDEPYY